MNNSKLHKAEFIKLIKNGDKNAFREVFDHYQKNLYFFIFSITKSDYASEDILQEVFVKIWTNRKNIDPSKSFDSFIFTIAKNLAYNHLRNVANQKALRKEIWRNVKYIGRDTENMVLAKEYEEIVNDILENIPVKKRSIFILSKQQGKTNQEIADLLGISPKTVKNHLWKTLRMIRAQLKPYLTDTVVSILYAISLFN